MKRKFTLDKRNAVFLGVCSGIAEFTGLNATVIRISAIIFTLLGAFPWTFVAYGVAAWLAKPGGWRGQQGSRASLRDLDPARQDLDRRLAEVDTYVAGPNSSLAREIDSLR
jgi:phage shock protein C